MCASNKYFEVVIKSGFVFSTYLNSLRDKVMSLFASFCRNVWMVWELRENVAALYDSVFILVTTFVVQVWVGIARETISCYDAAIRASDDYERLSQNVQLYLAGDCIVSAFDLHLEALHIAWQCVEDRRATGIVDDMEGRRF